MENFEFSGHSEPLLTVEEACSPVPDASLSLLENYQISVCSRGESTKSDPGGSSLYTKKPARFS